MSGSILAAREAVVCRLSFPRWAIGTDAVGGGRGATALQHRRITSGSDLRRTKLRPRLQRGAVHATVVVKLEERSRAAVGHVAGGKPSGIRLRDIEVMRSRCWRLHWLVVGPGSGCQSW